MSNHYAFRGISKEHTSCPERTWLDDGSEIMVLSEIAVVCGANNAQLRLIYLELGFSPKFPATRPIFLPPTFEISSLVFHLRGDSIQSTFLGSSPKFLPRLAAATFLNFRNPVDFILKTVFSFSSLYQRRELVAIQAALIDVR